MFRYFFISSHLCLVLSVTVIFSLFFIYGQYFYQSLLFIAPQKDYWEAAAEVNDAELQIQSDSTLLETSVTKQSLVAPSSNSRTILLSGLIALLAIVLSYLTLHILKTNWFSDSFWMQAFVWGWLWLIWWYLLLWFIKFFHGNTEIWVGYTFCKLVVTFEVYCAPKVISANDEYE